MGPRVPGTAQGIFAEGAKDKKREARLNDALLDFDLFVGNQAAFYEETASIFVKQVVAAAEQALPILYHPPPRTTI